MISSLTRGPRRESKKRGSMIVRYISWPRPGWNLRAIVEGKGEAMREGRVLPIKGWSRVGKPSEIAGQVGSSSSPGTLHELQTTPGFLTRGCGDVNHLSLEPLARRAAVTKVKILVRTGIVSLECWESSGETSSRGRGCRIVHRPSLHSLGSFDGVEGKKECEGMKYRRKRA
jgi:hypothetical protein